MTRVAPVDALLRAAHGGPATVVTVLTVLLAAIAGVRPAGVVLVGLGMIAGQLSVGWSNDWLDADLDARARRRDKPAATGAIAPATLRTAALVALVPGLLLPFGASVPAGALHVLFIASAWGYNLGLKRTPASVLPYVVSFGSLPAIAALARTPPAWPAPWTLAVGAALGVAAHFANVVPDVDRDRAARVLGLPQLLGARASAAVAAIVVLLAVLVVLAGLQHEEAPPEATVALVPPALCGLAGLVGAVRGGRGRRPFRLVMAAALLLTLPLLLTPSALR